MNEIKFDKSEVILLQDNLRIISYGVVAALIFIKILVNCIQQRCCVKSDQPGGQSKNESAED